MTAPVVGVAWLAAGGLAGVLHAWLLWRGRARAGAAGARLGLVSACLVVAALAGGIAPTAAGWGIGLVAHGTFLWRRAMP